MFFVHQHKDDDDIKDIVTNITSFKDIDINDIKDTKYLMIDIKNIVYRHAIQSIDMSGEVNLRESFLNQIHIEFFRHHNKNCKLLNNFDIICHWVFKGCYELIVYELVENDINETINKIKQSIPGINVFCISPIVYEFLPFSNNVNENNKCDKKTQMNKLGVNAIDQYLSTKTIIDMGLSYFLFGFNSFDESKDSYLYLHPETIREKVVIVTSYEEDAINIYNVYKLKYPNHIDKLKLYLFDKKLDSNPIHCNCIIKQNQGGK